MLSARRGAIGHSGCYGKQFSPWGRVRDLKAMLILTSDQSSLPVPAHNNQAAALCVICIKRLSGDLKAGCFSYISASLMNLPEQPRSILRNFFLLFCFTALFAIIDCRAKADTYEFAKVCNQRLKGKIKYSNENMLTTILLYIFPVSNVETVNRGQTFANLTKKLAIRSDGAGTHHLLNNKPFVTCKGTQFNYTCTNNVGLSNQVTTAKDYTHSVDFLTTNNRLVNSYVPGGYQNDNLVFCEGYGNQSSPFFLRVALVDIYSSEDGIARRLQDRIGYEIQTLYPTQYKLFPSTERTDGFRF